MDFCIYLYKDLSTIPTKVSIIEIQSMAPSSPKVKLRLRILAMHEARNRPLLYISFDISINILSFTNLRDMFLTKVKVHGCKKCTDIWKVTSGGRAEIENVKIASGSIFNSSSAIRGHFSTFSVLFASLDPSSKKVH